MSGHPADEAAGEVLDDLEALPDDKITVAEVVAERMAGRWRNRHDAPSDSPTHPGAYLVNATGEMTALATEAGDGDRKLLMEALEEYDALPTTVEPEDYDADLLPLHDELATGVIEGREYRMILPIGGPQVIVELKAEDDNQEPDRVAFAFGDMLAAAYSSVEPED